MPFAYTFRGDDMNALSTEVRDLLENRDRELELYLNQPELSIARVANQTYNNGATADISFDTEYTDTHGFITPTSANITVPSGAEGLYAIGWAVTWNIAGISKTATLYLNSDPVYTAASANGTKIIYHANLKLVATDVLTLRCTNSSGAIRQATATLMMTRLMA